MLFRSGGNELQMSCDLAIAADDTFIKHVGVARGSVPGAGATQWLPIIVGDRRAREILLLCEEIPIKKALEWGLVNRSVPAADLDASVDALAPSYPQARLFLNVFAYAIAFVVFNLVYQTRGRSLVTATATLIIAFALALDALVGRIEQRLMTWQPKAGETEKL